VLDALALAVAGGILAGEEERRRPPVLRSVGLDEIDAALATDCSRVRNGLVNRGENPTPLLHSARIDTSGPADLAE